jgi:hypothetical protein
MDRVPSLMGFSATAIAALVTCCSSSGDPAAEQDQSLELLEATQPGTCGSVGSADPGEPEERFRSCLSDDDCVAVPVVGCCHNGWKTSVSRGRQDEYEGSFRCPNERPICPKYLVIDSRAPECNQDTGLCELVPVDGQCVPASSP